MEITRMVAKGPSPSARVRTICLPSPIDDQASARAAMRGIPVEEYLSLLLERSLAASADDEALAPFRQQVAESKMSSEDLDEFFEALRMNVPPRGEGVTRVWPAANGRRSP